MNNAGTFAAVAVGLLIAHAVADTWVQTHAQALAKGQRNMAGRVACAKHVASYTAVTACAVLSLWGAFQLDITWWGFAAGQLLSAITHYWADRRFTLARLAALLGKTPFYILGQPRGLTVTVDRTERHDLSAGGHTLSLVSEQVPLDQPTLGTGAYALDQSWHWGWLGVAAFLTAVI